MLNEDEKDVNLDNRFATVNSSKVLDDLLKDVDEDDELRFENMTHEQILKFTNQQTVRESIDYRTKSHRDAIDNEHLHLKQTMFTRESFGTEEDPFD